MKRAAIFGLIICTSYYAAATERSCNPKTELGMSDGFGGHQYRCQLVAGSSDPKAGRWVEDIGAERQIALMTSKRIALANAMMVRRLSPSELKKAMEYGPDLFAPLPGVTYYSNEVLIKFEAALRIQEAWRSIKGESR